MLPYVVPVSPAGNVAMLRNRIAFAVHSDVRAARVTGSDARSWLHDLVTADVESLSPGQLRWSMLLGPTGRIRASFAVAGEPDAVILIQADDQPDVISLLAPYVLSSDVRLAPDMRMFLSAPEAMGSPQVWEPSLLPLREPAGVLLATDHEGLPGLRDRLVTAGLAEASPADVEMLRVIEGIPRLAVDLDDLSLPAEAGWEDRIDLTKGCFLGQESVAKVRNLGHPPRVVLALRSEGAVQPGDDVLADREVVGTVTSAVPLGDGCRVILRVRWNSSEADLTTASGGALLRP